MVVGQDFITARERLATRNNNFMANHLDDISWFIFSVGYFITIIYLLTT